MIKPRHFSLNVSDSVIADLRERLKRTRWPDEPPLAPWSTGTSVEWMKEIVAYWQAGFDWGAGISSVLGHRYPDRLIGIHLNLLMVRRELNFPAEDEKTRTYKEQLAHFLREETGYQAIQGTKPQTLAFGLTDSPAGLAAWIAEKFRTWSDCGGVIENAISRDELLANVARYWFTGAIGSSFWP